MAEVASDGAYVDIDKNIVDEAAAGYVGGTNIILSQLASLTGIVSTTKTEFSDNTAAILELLDSLLVPQELLDKFDDFMIDDIQSIDFQELVAPDPPSLPGFDDVTFPLAPIFKPVPDIDLDFTAPTKPTAINPALNYSTESYGSDMWLDLFTKVKNGVIGIDPSIDAGTETALFDRARDRQRIPREKALRAATTELTARGVKFPQLAVRSLQQRAFSEAAQEDTNLNSDIYIKQSDLAIDYKKFIIEKAVAIEQILREFHINYHRLDLDAAIASAQLIVTTYAENIKLFVAEWEGIVKERTSAIEGINAFIAQNRLLGDVFEIQTKGAIAQTDLISSERKSLVDAYKTEGDVYEAKVRALASWYGALTENQKLHLEKSRLELEAIVQEIRAKLDGEISYNNLKEKILEALSNVLAQIMASAMNAINTSVGHSTSYTEQRGETWSHSDSLNETRNISQSGPDVAS
jgi:hypothetical protein